MNRDRLEEIPAGTELLREVRHMPDEAFEEVTLEELVNAARWLRAASYSAGEGARRLDRLIQKRTNQTDQDPAGTPPDPDLQQTGPTPCTSSPTPSAPSGTTDEHPPDDRPASAR